MSPITDGTCIHIIWRRSYIYICGACANGWSSEGHVHVAIEVKGLPKSQFNPLEDWLLKGSAHRNCSKNKLIFIAIKCN